MNDQGDLPLTPATTPENAADVDLEEDELDTEAHADKPGLAERFREMRVGVTDPNIIGDAGPTDVPPGADGPPSPLGILEVDEDRADRDVGTAG